MYIYIYIHNYGIVNIIFICTVHVTSIVVMEQTAASWQEQHTCICICTRTRQHRPACLQSNQCMGTQTKDDHASWHQLVQGDVLLQVLPGRDPHLRRMHICPVRGPVSIKDPPPRLLPLSLNEGSTLMRPAADHSPAGIIQLHVCMWAIQLMRVICKTRNEKLQV